MLRRLCDGFGFVLIVGYRNTSIDDVDELFGGLSKDLPEVVFQLVDTASIGGPEHLFFSAVNAAKAFSKGLSISKKLDVEILLHVSGQRQISEAVRMVGVKKNSREVALVAITENEKEAAQVESAVRQAIRGTEDDSVLKIGSVRKLAQLFGLTNFRGDKGMLERLLVERAALLVTRR